MRLSALTFVSSACLACSAMSAHADTLDFTVTITQQSAIPYPAPIATGSVYTGSATFAGSFVENAPLPTITGFKFNFPGASPLPLFYSELSLMQTYINGPVSLAVVYTNPFNSKFDFNLVGSSFQVANYANPNAGLVEEEGTVAYTYVPDAPPVPPPSAVPEPSTFVLLGTGLLTTAGAVRRRLTRA